MIKDPPTLDDARSTDESDGLFLDGADVSGNGNDKVVTLQGRFRIYVKSGSQLAIWEDFPQAILVTAKDVTTGKTYETMDISTTGSSDPDTIDEYGSMPANQMVEKPFEISLFERLSGLPRDGAVFDIYVSYLAMWSNTIRVNL